MNVNGLNISKEGILFFDITDEYRSERSALLSQLYPLGRCGICEEKGVEVFWFSPYSNFAHARCCKAIAAAETPLMEAIDHLFKERVKMWAYNGTHISAIKAIRAACGSQTILCYLKKNGIEALKTLFVTVGIEAAKAYAQKNL